MSAIEDENSKPSQQEEPRRQNSNKSKTPLLDSFGTDLTKKAEEGKLEQVIGRENEIDRVIQVLSRKKKNNPVLIGEPGVGKTAIAEGIAVKIMEKKCSRVLHGRRLVTLELSAIVAGTKYRGQFEERMKAIMDELIENPEVILFIDELHTIIGAGNSAGSLDASNMLKPALARGQLQVIGATTIDEYKKTIEKDGAMERRFQKVLVEPPSAEQTLEIITNIKGIYEKHHNVVYTPEALAAAVTLSDRYITNRQFPDKAIDIIDEVGARTHIDNLNIPADLIELEKQHETLKAEKNAWVKEQKYEEAAKLRDKEKNLVAELERRKVEWEAAEKTNPVPVHEVDVAKVVSKMIGVPVTRITEDEGEKLLRMEDELRARVVGQDEAVAKVTEAIQRARSGLNDPKKPIASLIFLGSTGIGKTELSKALAEFLFNDEDAITRIDMSEYMEPHSVSKLIGAPPGYVGYEEGGQLTEKVRQKPYSIILLDEIEKAHPLVFNILLQVLDDGRLTDGLGRTINFKNTIIIMTSNAGSQKLLENKSLGFGLGEKKNNVKEIVMTELKKLFRPEFINRVDELVFFNRLSKENVAQITRIHIKKFGKTVAGQGYTLEVTDTMTNKIADEGFSDEFGARPIKRAITSLIQNEISKAILRKQVKPGDTIVVDYDKESDRAVVTKK